MQAYTIHISIYSSVNTHLHMHMPIPAQIHKHVHTHINTCMLSYTYTHVYVNLHAVSLFCPSEAVFSEMTEAPKRFEQGRVTITLHS